MHSFLNFINELPKNEADTHRTPFISIEHLSEEVNCTLNSPAPKGHNLISPARTKRLKTPLNISKLKRKEPKCRIHQAYTRLSRSNSKDMALPKSKRNIFTLLESNSISSCNIRLDKRENSKTNPVPDNRNTREKKVRTTPFLGIRTRSTSQSTDSSCVLNDDKFNQPEVTFIDGMKFVCHDLRDECKDSDINHLVNQYLDYDSGSDENCCVTSSPKKTDDVRKIKGVANRLRYKEDYEESFHHDDDTYISKGTKKLSTYVYGMYSHSDEAELMYDPFTLMTGVQLHELEDFFVNLSKSNMNMLPSSEHRNFTAMFETVSSSSAIFAVSAVAEHGVNDYIKNSLLLSSENEEKPVQSTFPVISESDAMAAVNAYIEIVEPQRSFWTTDEDADLKDEGRIVSLQPTKAGRISKIPARFRDKDFDVELPNVMQSNNRQKRSSVSVVVLRQTADVKSNPQLDNAIDLNNHQKNELKSKTVSEIQKESCCSCKTDVHYCQSVDRNVNKNNKNPKIFKIKLNKNFHLNNESLKIQVPNSSSKINIIKFPGGIKHVGNSVLKLGNVIKAPAIESEQKFQIKPARSLLRKDIPSQKKIVTKFSNVRQCEANNTNFSVNVVKNLEKVEKKVQCRQDEKSFITFQGGGIKHVGNTFINLGSIIKSSRIESEQKSQNELVQAQSLLHKNIAPQKEVFTKLSDARQNELNNSKFTANVVKKFEKVVEKVEHDQDEKSIFVSDSEFNDSEYYSLDGRKAVKKYQERDRRINIRKSANDLAIELEDSSLKNKVISMKRLLNQAVHHIRKLEADERSLVKKKKNEKIRNIFLKIRKEKLLQKISANDSTDTNNRVIQTSAKSKPTPNSQAQLESENCDNSYLNEMMNQKNLLTSKLAAQLETLKKQKAALNMHSSESCHSDVVSNPVNTCLFGSVGSPSEVSTAASHIDHSDEVNSSKLDLNFENSTSTSASNAAENIKYNRTRSKSCTEAAPSNRQNFKLAPRILRRKGKVKYVTVNNNSHVKSHNYLNETSEEYMNNNLIICPSYPSQDSESMESICPRIINYTSISQEEFACT